MESLVALVICLLAVGLGVMLLAHHRESALREKCKLNLMQLGGALQAYDKALSHLPPSRIAEGYATWGVLLMPYLPADFQQHPLQKWNKEESYFAQPTEVRESRLVLFFCPQHPRTDTLSLVGDVDAAGKQFPGGLGDYASVAGDGSPEHLWTGSKANGALVMAEVIERKEERILKWKSQTSLAMIDHLRGKSYTMLVGEKHVPLGHEGDAHFGDGSLYNGQNPASFSRVAGPGFALAPDPSAPFNNNFGSYHRGICFFLFADNSVRPMTNDMSENVLGQLARR